MHVIDTHFHWWPRSIFELLCKRKGYPRARVNDQGGYDYLRHEVNGDPLAIWGDFFDLDGLLEHMDKLGHQVDIVCSIGPLSALFSELPAEEGRDLALQWNEEMAGA